MKKIIKWALIAVGALFILVLVVGIFTGNEPREIGTTAEYDDRTADILGAEFLADYEGAPAVRVTIRFQNDNSSPAYLLESFNIQAFQDGIGLDYISLNDESRAAKNTITAVKNGASIECAMVFALRSDSEVKLELSTPTADADLLAQQTFSR